MEQTAAPVVTSYMFCASYTHRYRTITEQDIKKNIVDFLYY